MAEAEVLMLNQKLLMAIGTNDWATYEQLCADDLTCFEAEALGHLASGLPFHKFYFDLPAGPSGGAAKVNNSMSAPHVRLLGDNAAVVAYVRLTQKLDANGNPVTVKAEETRVWEKRGGQWKHVHVHRSRNA